MRKLVKFGMIGMLALGSAACSAMADKKEDSASSSKVVVVWAEAEPDDGNAPLKVKLTCAPLNKSKPVKYEWDFGDATSPGKGETVTHTYEKPGVYKAHCIATDAAGVRGQDETQIDVE